MQLSSVMSSRWAIFVICLIYKPTPFIQIFKDATLFFLRSTPSIATVIPAMDHIDEHLATAALNADYPMAIKAALAIGKTTLNRYYNKTDLSEIFRIAMGMIYSTFRSLGVLTNFVSQFYILNSSLTTSKRLDGRRLG